VQEVHDAEGAGGHTEGLSDAERHEASAQARSAVVMPLYPITCTKFCNCSGCRNRRDREFCGILFYSYTAEELNVMYPGDITGMQVKLVIAEGMTGELILAKDEDS